MRETIWKDLLLSGRDLLLSAFILALTLALLSGLDDMSARAVAVFAGLMAAVFPVTLVTREDKSKGVALACSLPVTRRTVVRARYVLGVALALAGVFLALAIVALLPTSSLSASVLFAAGPLLLSTSLALLFMGLMLPLTLRLGARGLIALLVGLQIVGVVLFTAMQLTAWNADLHLVEGLVDAVGSAHEALGGTGFRLALAAALGVFLTASYGLSVFLFEGREL